MAKGLGDRQDASAGRTGLKAAFLLLGAALALLGPLSPARATPCTGLEWKTATLSEMLAIPGDVVRQLKKTQPTIRTATIVRGFQSGDWLVLHASPDAAEDAFLFYRHTPAKFEFVTLWAGAAAPSEGPEIEAWAMSHAPGISVPLAACFAWYVTTARA